MLWTVEVQVVCSMENCDVSPSTLTGCAGALVEQVLNDGLGFRV